MKADTPRDDLRIVELQAENFKRLTAVTIKPDGSMIVISGKNGAGKTSALDAIAVAIGGKKAAPKEPIRKGANKAEISLDLGRLRIRRTFTRDDAEGEISSTLTLEQADGSRPRSPQALLDDLMGELAFDPLDFLRKPAKDRFDTLKLLVPEIDFDGIAKQREAAFNRRTEVNRDAKRERAAAQVIVIDPDLPANAPDITALIAELRAAGQYNTELEGRASRRRAAGREIDELNDRAEKLRAEATSLEARAIELQARLDAAEELPAPKDTAKLERDIELARAQADAVEQRARRQAHIDAANRLEESSAALTLLIEKLDADKQDGVAKAQLPAGLSIGEGNDIQLAGVPFDQASAAEQLRASTAIAMALNPRLRVILIRDGSLLDADSMALLAGMAADRGYQVFVERVAGDKPAGIVIEDGRIK
jgi:DNA repair exonuclease SbcCD ATPase subunit